jgi:uncharacterized protein YbaR (Trm112 family)
MHILLTDVLACPRCGPAFGLIVIADRLEDRHVVEGRLGCANCRSSYPVVDRVADLRVGNSAEASNSAMLAADSERAFRIAALLGVSAAPSTILVLDRTGSTADEIAPILSGVHVIGGAAEDGPRDPDLANSSPILVGGRLPLRDRTMNGVALIGLGDSDLFQEAARVLVKGSRLVIEGAVEGAATLLQKAGLTLHLEQDGMVVAAAQSGR